MKNNSDEMIKNLECMKTPLGKKSVLNQDEWNYVHSNSFKNVYGDWESKVKKDFLLSNNTVAELTGNEFSKIEGMSLTDQVEKYFSSFGNTVSSPFFGNVILDREGADSSLAHGMGRLKAVAYAGVKDVIENGVIIDADCNHKERGYNSFIVASPIKINDENYICEVVLKQNLKETKFYLHEVTEQKKFLERAFVTNSAQKPAHQGTILSILNKALDVNDKVICPMNETETKELIKIFQQFGIYRNSLSKEHDDFVKQQLQKKYDNVTKTYELQGKIYTGTFRENPHRKENKVAYEKEAKLATVLASMGFDVVLIEEDNTKEGTKPDAIVNGIVMDFKEIEAFYEHDTSKNSLGRNYRDGMRKEKSEGVVIYLHNFISNFIIRCMQANRKIYT